ncbi:MAG: DUF2934 domain-containing protein [Leptospiraceae bacterium]|nr:DUF2934 domain-containing protein [Leptospiraceae bacterium]MCP5499594.1 DUF2934 domain-containing protein [Leptospiraceae bacterium]
MSPDFLRCTGDFCPIKEHCLRYTMLVAGRQDFFGKPPFHSETGTCDYYREDRPDAQRIQEVAYFFWQKEGCPQNKDLEFWLKAEHWLLALNRGEI